LRSGPTKSKTSRLSVTQGNFVDACRNRLAKVWAIVPVPPFTLNGQRWPDRPCQRAQT